MSVRPVDIVMVQQMNEVSQIKQAETAKPMAQQFNIAAEVQKESEHKSEQVTKKSDVDNQKKKFDAKDKSDNEYYNDNHKNNKRKDGKVTIKGKDGFGFDVKV